MDKKNEKITELTPEQMEKVIAAMQDILEAKK